MLALLFSDHALPFTISLALFLLIALVETVCLFFGVEISGWLGFDSDLDVDFDAATGIDFAHEGIFTHIYSWLRIRQVPLLILLIVFLASFGLIGIAVQYAALSLWGDMLHIVPASIIAFLLSLPVVRTLAGILNRVMPKDETAAVSLDSLIGRTATIPLGVAKSGYPAQAKVVDQFGNTHYIMLEPDNADESIQSGENALLVRRVSGKFFAIKADELP